MTGPTDGRDPGADGPGPGRGDDGAGGSPLDRPRLGRALAIGSVIVVLLVLISLVAIVLGPVAGVERGALWTILLMILVTFATLGGIGYGFYRSSRDGTGGEPEEGG